MKILELEIKNIRGIKDIILKPEEKNIVVYGPNGSGKSAVVDSVEFLLTGKISRLAGEGTKNLSLKEHGPHVDYRDKLKEVCVKGKVKIDEYNTEIEIERKMNNNKLSIKPKDAEEYLKPYLDIAEMGQHVLSRREILKYITAESGKRATEIQSLLNLDKIENIRKNVVSINSTADKEKKNSDSNIADAKQNILNLLSISEFSELNIINAINVKRKLLNAQNIDKLSKETIKTGITPLPKSDTIISFTKEEIENKIRDVKNYINIKKNEITKNEEKLNKIIDEINKDKNLKKDLLQKKLIELGITLIDESGACPLCEREWEKGELIKYLNRRLQKSEIAKSKLEQINSLSGDIKTDLSIFRNSINNIIEFSKQIKLQLELNEYKKIKIELDEWIEIMLTPEDSYEKIIPPRKIQNVFNNKIFLDSLIAPVENALKTKTFEISTEQSAWDTLTKLEAFWEVYEQAVEKCKKSGEFKNRTEIILQKFEIARDTVLENTYNELKNKFNEYYVDVHQNDERDFNSSLKHIGAELILEVDFYKRGLFPPHALHSEGHQDSMGICLYLALNKHLTKDKMKLTVLDDVLMSIDNNHRRSFCQLLNKHFPDRQFIITTHDSIWAKQLKTEGIVEKKYLYHFTNWSVDTGPSFEFDKDLWDKIDADLTNNNIPSAAHKLRRESEYYFEALCDSLGAEIQYKSDARYELGDYASSLISIYKKYINKSLESANSWNKKDKVEELKIIEKNSSEIISKSQIEQWAINENVHYNKWDNFARSDFEPVVLAFKDLFNLFRCDNCNSIIFVCYEGKIKNLVRCNCQKINWNLKKNA
ncbi:MAG: AAA family ATPase [Ignavibacteriales bacterium]|nr:AAA family ATPase [Ignavibacteriales bacterium]